jgi:lysophospholipase L1-like esterase
MLFLRALLPGLVLAGAIGFSGCATRPPSQLQGLAGESVVFFGSQPARLAYPLSGDGPVRLRSTYLPGPETVTYEEGRDFRVDYAAGTLIRLPGSRLPDFRTNVLHGQEQFDHTKFPGYGNQPFFAYVDYQLADRVRWPVQAPQADRLRATQRKLAAGETVTIVAFGDSITNGGEASLPELIFWRRWVTDLQARYPRAKITAINGATGGDTTTRGLQRLQAKVLDAKPDLVLIGFGMNDHNRRGVPLPEFEQQLREMVTRIRAATTAEIVLFSTFPPNPRWLHGTNRMTDYAGATARVAADTGCAYADVFNNWQTLAARKRPEDLLANNINHPNDFGHWIYYRVFAAMEL